MALDFVATYFPAIADIPPATLLSARERLNTYLQQNFPDLDTRPNSVFGDLVLSPFAYLLAAQEAGMGNFMSDLDLENVANGVVYNCDFVKQYIQNFATVDQTTLQSSGVMRLIFCSNPAEDDYYIIDRRAQYAFGPNTFTLRLPNPGSLFILPVGTEPEPFTNQYALSQITETTYAIDIGVVGNMTVQVNAGDAGTTDYPLTGILTGISAVTNFNFGLPPESLAVLAAKTREAFYSATLTTRSGAKNYLNREFPDLSSVSPVLPGDTAAVRAAVNVFGVANGKMDVYMQSSNFGTQVSQTIPLTYDPGSSAYYGPVNFIEYPQVITSFQYAGDTTIDLGNKGITGPVTILSQSSAPTKAPLLTCAYSEYEDYWLRILTPSVSGIALFDPLTNLSDGSQYNYFTINYVADPLLPVVSDVLGSSDITPVGVDVLVKGFVPIVIDSLLITYTRRAGITMALDTARTEIYNYFMSLGYNTVYSASRIYDTMFYAGALDVVSISVNSNIQWTIADGILPSYVPSPTYPSQTGWNASLTGALLPPSGSGANNLTPNFAFDPTTYAVMEVRNRGYYLPASNILFSEVIY